MSAYTVSIPYRHNEIQCNQCRNSRNSKVSIPYRHNEMQIGLFNPPYASDRFQFLIGTMKLDNNLACTVI